MEKGTYKVVTGNIVPMITYFDNEGKIDEVACRLQALHILKNGGDAIFLLGSTGEGLFIKEIDKKFNYERSKLILVVIDTVIQFLYSKKENIQQNTLNSENSPIPIIIGAYGESGDDVLEDINLILKRCLEFLEDHYLEYQFISKFIKNKSFKQFLAQFIQGFVIPPPKQKLSEKHLEEFYKIILNSINFPVYIYNNPNSFGGNVITVNIIKELMNYNNERLKGIKDSSNALKQKEEYISFLSPSFSVSCGKEGMIGTFMQKIPTHLRKLAGVVPSIGNLTNVPKTIFDLGVNNKDKQMLELQAEMNKFRNKIYDSTVNKGKAQRGIKICFKKLYENLYDKIPFVVMPEFHREIPNEIIMEMYKTLEYCIEKNYIQKINLY
ncbi:MAG: dihydrodipicolinate synthase family protein [Promethearchaeota archaeon]